MISSVKYSFSSRHSGDFSSSTDESAVFISSVKSDEMSFASSSIGSCISLV